MRVKNYPCWCTSVLVVVGGGETMFGMGTDRVRVVVGRVLHFLGGR